MTTTATVHDLLASLNYRKGNAEQDIIDALRRRFGISTNCKLEEALKDKTPAQVLEAILQELQPFAYMIADVYTFLADAETHVGGKLEVLVPTDQARALKIDPRKFTRYEREIVETIQSFDIDVDLLPADGHWTNFHDGYWPPRCFEQQRSGEEITRCGVCLPERRIADFEHLTAYYEALARMAREQLELPLDDQLPPPAYLSWESILWRWEDCLGRTGEWHDQCILEYPELRHFFERSLSEFRAASHSRTVDNIRKFLALPYWKQRWQFYEVWFVTIVLRSYGLSNLRLETTAGKWRLDVGSVIPKPIATGRCGYRGEIKFYYQYQGTPPSSIFSGKQDRPEMLVNYENGFGKQQCLMAAEVKAREKKGFGLQDMKGSIFSLLEWEPGTIVGASYYDLGSGTLLSSQIIKNTELVFADMCQPRSLAATELTKWLEEFWKTQHNRLCS